jgi:hypothetical protein
MNKTGWGSCYPTHSAMKLRNGWGTLHLLLVYIRT